MVLQGLNVEQDIEGNTRKLGISASTITSAAAWKDTHPCKGSFKRVQCGANEKSESIPSRWCDGWKVQADALSRDGWAKNTSSRNAMKAGGKSREKPVKARDQRWPTINQQARAWAWSGMPGDKQWVSRPAASRMLDSMGGTNAAVAWTAEAGFSPVGLLSTNR